MIFLNREVTKYDLSGEIVMPLTFFKKAQNSLKSSLSAEKLATGLTIKTTTTSYKKLMIVPILTSYSSSIIASPVTALILSFKRCASKSGLNFDRKSFAPTFLTIASLNTPLSDVCKIT